MVMHRFANPARFLRFATVAMPWFAAAAIVCIAAGLWFALVASPADYQQGETVRIMYVHVPSAWMALLVYTVVAGGSISALVWKHPLGEIVARAAAPSGRPSPSSASLPARSGASPCGAPGGCGTRG